MNIAIYDNTDLYQEELRAQLRQFLQEYRLTSEVSRFGTAKELLDAVAAKRFDLVFFVLSGAAEVFAAARGVRERCMECEIMFLSETAQYVADVMQFRAMGYLLAPLKAAELNRAMERFLCYHGKKMHQYAVHTRLCDYLVPHDKIRYFRSDGHYVCVYVDGEAEPLAHLRRLDDIQKETAALPYVRCHQSYLVSRRVISGVSGRWLLLDDGERIPISRRYADQMGDLSRFFGGKEC